MYAISARSSDGRQVCMLLARVSPANGNEVFIMKYKISILSLAVATILLVSMVTAAGVSTAHPAAVGAPCGPPPASCWDGTNVWYVAQYGNTIYYRENGGGWTAIGTATNPAIVYEGGVGHVAIFVRGTDGYLYEKMTTDNGATWSPWAAWPGAVAAAPARSWSL